jgi:pyridoxine kinase
VDEGEAWLAATPKLPLHAHGTGDAFAALLLGHYLRHRRLDTAIAKATAAMHAIVEATVARDAYELALVAAQAHFDPDPPRVDLRRVR